MTTRQPGPQGRIRLMAAMLAVGLFAAYNANGREIGTYDTQPAKLAARALAQRGNLRLDADIARTPALAERPAFARDQRGHTRTAYSPVAPLAGGVVAAALAVGGLDLDAPLAPNLIAVLTASMLTTAAVVLLFLTMTRLVAPGLALAAAIGLGLGTNLWVVHSQTLGQHETVLFGISLALYGWTRRPTDIQTRHRWIGALGLALAVTARLQVLPLAGVLLAGLTWRLGWRRAIGPGALVALAVGTLMAAQWRWFGHPLGAMPALTALHPDVHAVAGPLGAEPWIGVAGLLVSPSRGLLVFSPIVIIAVCGIVPALRLHRDLGLGWGFTGTALQVLAYGAYAVWWGGHSYGPRYALDAIAPLVPAGAVALATVCRAPLARLVCTVALAWSVVAAGTGAFYANSWNTRPVDVDRNHDRLWDWTDLQVVRGWRDGLSPQDFDLFSRAAYRSPASSDPGPAE